MQQFTQATNRVVTQSRYIRSRRHARHVDIRDPPYGAIDSPVLRLHGRALGVSDRPAPREPMTIPFLRLLPSRVGFAERDASRPAFGGSSLVSLTRHTCVGGGPLGPRRSVRACVRVSRPKKDCRNRRMRFQQRDYDNGRSLEKPNFHITSKLKFQSTHIK